ncbi:MAG: alanine racemase [Acidobacteriota bacterium]|nr:alanine racemase [Acidobacteriota bacterium]
MRITPLKTKGNQNPDLVQENPKPLKPVTPNPGKLLRPTWAEISCAALRRNYARVRQLAGQRRVMAVIKADAYGHGAQPVARILDDCGVDAFGVATIEEAIELRIAGISKPILLLGGIYMSDPAALAEHRLTPTVSSTARIDLIAACARRFGRSIEFHLKIDTGMGRLGMPPALIEAFAERWRGLGGDEVLRLSGVLTHLASAEDCVATQTDEQLAAFKAALERLRALGIAPELVHVSNSAALLARADIEENMVRPGLLFYGYSLPIILPPHAKARALPAFEPVLAFKSRVVFLKDQPAGALLGYSGSFYTRRPSRIAIIPVGYADGLNRALSNRGEVIVRGSRARIVGNISMDLTLVDVTDIPGVSVGDEVVLIGESGGHSITASDIARLLGTIPYEVLCSVGKRVPRIYVDDL